jgi:hypothetical protein
MGIDFTTRTAGGWLRQGIEGGSRRTLALPGRGLPHPVPDRGWGAARSGGGRWAPQGNLRVKSIRMGGGAQGIPGMSFRGAA